MPKRSYDLVHVQDSGAISTHIADDKKQNLSNKRQKINDMKTIQFDLEILYGLTNNMNNINLNR